MKGKVTMSPKQLMDKLYNGAWESKNWKLTASSKKTLFGAVTIIIVGAVAGSMIEKNGKA